jgi:hypothetical protein
MDFLGDTIRFAPIPTSPPRALLGGPFSDEAIIKELYGDVCMEVEHDSADYSVIAVNYASLKSKWKTYFEPKMASLDENSWVHGKMIVIGGVGLGNLGNQADMIRQLYNTGNEQLLANGRQMLQAGKSEEEVARWIISERNSLKAAIRAQGPALFKKYAEWRNMNKYKNPLGPNYAQLKAGKTDLAIIEGVTNTSKEFNALGGKIRIIGRSMEAFGFILQATENSPAALEPLPKSDEELVEIEQVRLRYGIPAGANIDRHGHLKPGYYLQVDMFDPHVGDEATCETEEIMWWLGADISYHYHDVVWTVPGRSW